MIKELKISVNNLRKFNFKKLERQYCNLYNSVNKMYCEILIYLNKDIFFYDYTIYKKYLKLCLNYLEKAVKTCNENISKNAELNKIKNQLTNTKSGLNNNEIIKINKIVNEFTLKYNKIVYKKLAEFEDLSNLIGETDSFLFSVLKEEKQNENVKVLFAETLKILQAKLKNTKYDIIYKNSTAFKRLEFIKDYKNSFIIVTKKELNNLKICNKLLGNIVNFPLWSIDGYNEVVFEDGKASGIYPEFFKEA